MKRIWTDEEIRVLKELYPTTMLVEEIAKKLNRTQSQVYCKARQIGLSKPHESFVQSGRMGTHHPKAKEHRFQKGHVPANKGKKMPEETYCKVQRTMFKKGQIPVNHREVGSERVNVDGYPEIKVAEPNRWKLKHRVVWEQANGKIPKGYNIQFKNHNPLDCRLENLYIISKAEQLKTENSLIARYPKEMQDVIRLKGVINRHIHKMEK